MGWDYNYRVDGSSLSPYCTAVVLDSEGGGGREGANVRIPGVDGERSGEKTHRAVTLALRTVLRWTGPDGTVTHINGEAGHIHENLSALKRLFGQGLVELARNDPEAGELRGLVELIDDPVDGEARHVFVWPLRLVEGSWYESEEQEATGNPPIVVTRGNRRIDDLTMIFDEAAVFTHIDEDGTDSTIEVLDPVGDAGGYPVTIRTGQHKSVIRDVDVVNDDPYLCLDGIGGRVFAADAAAFDITNNLDLRIRLRSSWSDRGILLSRIAPNEMWNWIIAPGNRLAFRWRDSTSTIHGYIFSSAFNFALNTTHWLRVRKSGTTLTFFISDDDTDDHTAVSWTTLSAHTVNGINMLTGTSGILIGHLTTSPGATLPAYWLAGQVFVAAILNNTTPVAVIDFTDDTEWTLGMRAGDQGQDAQGNTWTLQGTASIGCPFAAPGRIRVTQPYWMRFDPVNVSLVGLNTSAGGVNTPDSAALSITDDIDIRVRASLTSWGAGSQTFAAKRDVDEEWTFRTTGVGLQGLEFTWWQSNTPIVVNHPFLTIPQPNRPLWVRVVRSGTEVTFYTSTSPTQNHEAVSWSLLGAVSTSAGSIDQGATHVVIGAATSSFDLEELVGQIHAAAILSAGVVAADIRFDDETQGWIIGDDAGDTGTDPEGNVWTIVGDAEILPMPQEILTTAPVTVRWRNRWA